MRKRVLTGLISGLLCCSLIGVGFATWAVTGDASGSVTGGNITAEAIEDKTLAIANLTITDGTVSFGAASNSASLKNIWLTNSSVKTNDDLTATITFSVTNYDYMNGKPSYTFEAVNKKSDFQDALDANVISGPTFSLKDNTNGSYTLTLTFAWGDAFKDPTDGTIKNPYVFYNSHKATDNIEVTHGTVGSGMTYKAHALKYMPIVYALNGATFKVKIGATAKTDSAS